MTVNANKTCQGVHHLQVTHYLVGDVECLEGPAQLHLVQEQHEVVTSLRAVIS